jgi:transcriptional regulator with PAS, ATPase and Fis domain
VATGKFVLRDEALAQRLDKAVRALAHGMPVLLEGETGTGKEVFARALREAVRPTGPFIALNCAAIPEGLIEAELFGYTDGAFTGGRKGGAKGKIELAHDGVLLLDEIGDMPLAMQSRLLRVLQERAVMRIGGEREVPVDTLVISATHQHLENLVARGSFRQDLFYRLNGFTLQLPALRERTDIAEIVEALLREASGESDGNAESAPLTSIITLRALAVLIAHPWPGNIRQLQHTIRSMIALRCNDNPIDVTDLPAELHGLADEQDAGDCESPCSPRTLEETERRVIQRALREHGDNISAAARSLGISRTTLYKRLKNPGKTMAR